MSLSWKRVSVDAQEAGQYRILRTDTNDIKRYLVFYGRTTSTKVPQLLGGFEDPIGAQMCADEHHAKHGNDQVP